MFPEDNEFNVPRSWYSWISEMSKQEEEHVTAALWNERTARTHKGDTRMSGGRQEAWTKRP